MDRSFLVRHPAEVAFDLIGCHLTVLKDGELASGRIVETEAYAGVDDLASHSARMASAREVMSRDPGTVYVYRSYGIHLCLNVVAHHPGFGGAVLIRAIEPTTGLDQLRARRGDVPDVQLMRGPGNVGQALGISLDDVGDDMIDGTVYRLQLRDAPVTIACSPRIGISKAVERPWRYFDTASASVSVSRQGTIITMPKVRQAIARGENR